MAATGSNLAIDGQGNIWRTGQNLPVALTGNAFQKTSAGTVCGTQQLSPFEPPTAIYCSHAFVMKQDPNGNVLYATYLGGSNADGGIAITTDAQNNAYVVGFTYSPDFPVTAGVVQRQNKGPLTPRVVIDALGPFGPAVVLPGGDIFVAKFAPDGTLLYSTLLGGTGWDIPALIAVDADGSAYLAGTTWSTDFPVTPTGMTHQSEIATFFARLDPQAASLVYSTYSDPTVQSFAIDAMGDAFLTGGTQPPNVSAGPYITEIDTSGGQVLYSTFLPDLDAKYVGAGAAIAVNVAGEALVGVSPAPVPPQLLVYAPLVYPFGPSFFVTLANGGGSVLAETDIDNAQFDRVMLDSAGNAYAFGRGTSALPPAATAPLLNEPCSSSGGAFVLEADPAGAITVATYLRQGSGDVDVIGAPGQLTVYRSISQTMLATTQADLLTVPEMNFGCPVNLASGQTGPGLAEGQIFELFGTNLGPPQAASATTDESGRFPTSLAGVQVVVNGTPAPLLFVQAGQIAGVVPFGNAPGVRTIQVQYQDQAALPLDAPDSYNPGIFTIDGQAAVLNQDGTVNTPSNPARLGTIVSIYATGTGAFQTPIPDGEIVPLPPPYFTLAWIPEVRFAEVVAEVVWAGAAPGLIAGAAQINARLPASLPAGTNLAAVPVIVISNGAFSPAAPISVME